MARQPEIRPVNENSPISGVGGYIEVSQPQISGSTPNAGWTHRFHIGLWEIWHDFTSAVIPISGGQGVSARRRVGSEFRFSTTIDLDRNEQFPFPENWFGGIPETKSSPEEDPAPFLLQAVFMCGDPTFWTAPELQSIARIAADSLGPHYRCNSVALDKAYANNSALGDDVVRFIVQGSGGSPLRRYVGQQWQGAGGLAQTKATLKHDNPKTGR